MRIAMVFHGSHRRGGVERSIWEYARHWKHEHDVTVIASDIDRTDMDGVAIREVQVSRSSPYRFGRAAARHYRVDEFDHVLSFGVQPVPATVAWVGSVHRAWLEASRRFPGASRLKHPALRYLLPRHVERLTLERSYFRRSDWTRVVTCADAVGRDLTRLYGVDPGLLSTVNNGFDPVEFNPARRLSERSEARAEWGLPDDAVVLSMAVNELARKGYDVLLRATAAAANPRLHILLAGADPARYSALTASLGLTEHVHWVGRQGDVGRVHAASDVYVMPTKYEAFCLAIIEALASGLPVVTTAVPGAGDMIESGVNGYVQRDPESHEELAGLLEQVSNDEQRTRLTAAARPSVEHLTWKALGERAIGILAEHPRRPINGR